MPEEVQDHRVDALRQQLRSLGYLDAGVDRFLLAPAGGSRSRVSVAIRSGLRVGVLAAAVLGPAAALGIAFRLPGLVTGVRDALVLAAYFAAMFFVVFSVASFVVAIAASAIVRDDDPRFAIRAQRVSRGAGVVLAIGTLAYLTLWWRTASAGFGWSAPVWTAAALVLAVAISLLLGHAARIATLGVLASTAGPAMLPPVTRRSWRITLAGGAAAFLAASIVLVVTASSDAAPAAVPSLTVVPTGIRLKVIAIDGVDPRLFDAGAWTTFPPSPAVTGAVVGERYALEPEDTSDPARVWTTIATGEPPDVHGVHTIETRRVAGLRGILPSDSTAVGRVLRTATDMIRLTRPSVASRNERRSMMVWEVAEQAGLRTAVVNWWATWPAVSKSGLVLTDRAILRLEHGGTLDGEIAPADLYATLRQQWLSLRAEAARKATAAFTRIDDPNIVGILRRSAELDATVVGLTDALPGPARDLDVVYLPGLDIAQHALLAGDEGGAPAPSAIAARVSALSAYLSFVHDLLAPWLRPSAGQFVMLITEPGRIASATPGTLTVFGVLPPPGHVEQPAIRDAGSASVTDIAPSILASLGIPLSRELAGEPRAAAVASVPRYVETYGPPFKDDSGRRGKPLDQEAIERLRSLGYIK
jgi:hypothetical protein